MGCSALWDRCHNLWLRLKPWLPFPYAVWAMLGVPTLLYTLLPIEDLVYPYYIVVGAFAFVGSWVFIESCIAYGSTLLQLVRAGLNLRIDPWRTWPEITYMIPAYLNNEASILDDTMQAYLRLRYPGHINVMIVYNARGNLRHEEEVLRAQWHGFTLGNLSVTVLANNKSKSKAENVNAGLLEVTEETEYIFVMDADHHPFTGHAALAILTMELHGYDVLQGACTIRRAGLLTNIVAAEFADMYNVGHRGRTSLFGIGVFGGSNGCWRRDLLCSIGMDHTMLTEDIDSSLRSTLQGAKIGYCSQLISSEEAPETEKTLRKQRLRWAQGWFEVSLKHLVPLTFSRHTSLRQKLGFITLLGFRECFVYLTFHPLILLVTFAVRAQFVALDFILLVSGLVVFCVGPFRCLSAYLLSTGEVAKRPHIFILYLFVQIFWASYLNVIQVMGHCQHILGNNAWVATVRKSAVQPTAPGSDPAKSLKAFGSSVDGSDGDNTAAMVDPAMSNLLDTLPRVIDCADTSAALSKASRSPESYRSRSPNSLRLGSIERARSPGLGSFDRARSSGPGSFDRARSPGSPYIDRSRSPGSIEAAGFGRFNNVWVTPHEVTDLVQPDEDSAEFAESSGMLAAPRHVMAAGPDAFMMMRPIAETYEPESSSVWTLNPNKI